MHRKPDRVPIATLAVVVYFWAMSRTAAVVFRDPAAYTDSARQWALFGYAVGWVSAGVIVGWILRRNVGD